MMAADDQTLQVPGPAEMKMPTEFASNDKYLAWIKTLPTGFASKDEYLAWIKTWMEAELQNPPYTFTTEATTNLYGGVDGRKRQAKSVIDHEALWWDKKKAVGQELGPPQRWLPQRLKVLRAHFQRVENFCKLAASRLNGLPLPELQSMTEDEWTGWCEKWYEEERKTRFPTQPDGSIDFLRKATAFWQANPADCRRVYPIQQWLGKQRDAFNQEAWSVRGAQASEALPMELVSEILGKRSRNWSDVSPKVTIYNKARERARMERQLKTWVAKDQADHLEWLTPNQPPDWIPAPENSATFWFYRLGCDKGNENLYLDTAMIDPTGAALADVLETPTFGGWATCVKYHHAVTARSAVLTASLNLRDVDNEEFTTEPVPIADYTPRRHAACAQWLSRVINETKWCREVYWLNNYNAIVAKVPRYTQAPKPLKAACSILGWDEGAFTHPNIFRRATMRNFVAKLLLIGTDAKRAMQEIVGKMVVETASFAYKALAKDWGAAQKKLCNFFLLFGFFRVLAVDELARLRDQQPQVLTPINAKYTDVHPKVPLIWAPAAPDHEPRSGGGGGAAP